MYNLVEEALKACMDELYMIHSQYGDKEHARKHSVALAMAEKALIEMNNLKPSLGNAYDGSPMNLDWFINSLSILTKPLSEDETGNIRIYRLSQFVNSLKPRKLYLDAQLKVEVEQCSKCGKHKHHSEKYCVSAENGVICGGNFEK